MADGERSEFYLVRRTGLNLALNSGDISLRLLTDIFGIAVADARCSNLRGCISLNGDSTVLLVTNYYVTTFKESASTTLCAMTGSLFYFYLFG